MVNHNSIDDKKQAQGQRRQVTVLFADIADFTPLAERLGEEKSFHLMQKASGQMMAAVQFHGGTIQDFTGDGIMALFGAPMAMEDAPLCACRAALDIQAGMRDLEDELESLYGARPKVRVGVHAGPLVVGEVGQGQGSQLTAIGDTVNMASRLESVAAAGGICISEALCALVEGRVEVSNLGMQTLKGKSETQRVFRLDGIGTEKSRFDASRRRGLTRLVERGPELDVLNRCWESAQTGGIQVVHIVGEAGIGKSRLMHEFRRRLPDEGPFVLTGDCRANSETAAFVPFIEVLRTSLQISADDDRPTVEQKITMGMEELGLPAADTLPYLMALLGQEVDDTGFTLRGADLIGIRTRRTLLDLLWQRCRTTPVMLFVEDLHWIDSSSEELLERIVTAENDVALLVVCTHRPQYRPGWSSRANVTEVALDPLSRDGTIALLSERLGTDDLAGELMRLAVEKAEGNPLFAEEIANFLEEKSRGDAGQPARIEATVLPANLQNLLMDRFDHLEEGPREVLQLAAIVGRKFSASLLRQVASPDCDVSLYLAELESQELVFAVREPDADFAFKHALVQDAIYDTMMTAHRRDLHGQVADALEHLYSNRPEEIADALARHYDLAGNKEKTIRYLTIAGRKSLMLFSLDEANRRFSRAVEIYESKPDTSFSTEYSEIISIWMDVLFWKSNIRKIIDIIHPRLEKIEQSGETKFFARILAYYGVAHVFMMDLDKAEEYLSKSRYIGETINDSEGLGFSYIGIIFMNCLKSRPGFSETVDDLLNSFKNLPQIDANPFLLSNVNFLTSWRYMVTGDLDEVRESGMKSIELGRRTSYPGAVGYGYFWIAFDDVASGRFEKAEKNSILGAKSSGGLIDGIMCDSALGIAMMLSGRPVEAQELLDKVRKEIFEEGFLSLTNIVDVPIGAAKVLKGDMAAGVKWIEDTISNMSNIGNSHASANGHLVLGEIYLQMATSTEKPPLDLMLRNAMFLLRTVPFAKRKALRHLYEAIRIGREIGMNGIVAQALMDTGLVHKSNGRLTDAKHQLEEARAVASTLKWKFINNKIASELKALE